MDKLFINILTKLRKSNVASTNPAFKEIVRKSIHCLIVLAPIFAAMNIYITLFILMAGTLFYAIVEHARIKGYSLSYITEITELVSRDKDKTRFVYGPVTLGIGAVLSLLLFPNPVATIAICALAFGDSAASIFGKGIPSLKLPFSKNKSLAGTLACFIVVFLCTFKITQDPLLSLPIAMVAALIESMPTGDMDNIILPVGTGIFSFFLLYHFL
ncbi:MAG: phosphatidate cytidylyltransferase [Spirochaetales bacterium]|nr:phosphatidate cytidylyltransferase [Spirochaetales bacterium]